MFNFISCLVKLSNKKICKHCSLFTFVLFYEIGNFIMIFLLHSILTKRPRNKNSTWLLLITRFRPPKNHEFISSFSYYFHSHSFLFNKWICKSLIMMRNDKLAFVCVSLQHEWTIDSKFHTKKKIYSHFIAVFIY